MKHFSSRRDGAPINTLKSRLRVIRKDISIIIRFHQTAKVSGWYRELLNLLRYVLGIHGAGGRNKSEWLICFISNYLMSWVSKNISNEATRKGLLDCLDAAKYLLIANKSGGSKGVEILITDSGSNG